MRECKYCGKEFDDGLKLGGHIVWCKNNPKVETSKQKSRNRMLGSNNPSHRAEVRQKISDTIKENVRNDNWHLSFSKKRTIEYEGHKFHGAWEVEYAKWLDSQAIRWRRPTEKFKYEFDAKTRYYTPDFYLIAEQQYVEIKGYPTEKDFAKWEAFPLSLKILNGQDLFSLGIIRDYRKVKREYKGKSWNT